MFFRQEYNFVLYWICDLTGLEENYWLLDVWKTTNMCTDINKNNVQL